MILFVSQWDTFSGCFDQGDPEVHESMSPTGDPPASIPVCVKFSPVLSEQQPTTSPESGPLSTPPTPLTPPAGPELTGFPANLIEKLNLDNLPYNKDAEVSIVPAPLSPD